MFVQKSVCFAGVHVYVINFGLVVCRLNGNIYPTFYFPCLEWSRCMHKLCMQMFDVYVYMHPFSMYVSEVNILHHQRLHTLVATSPVCRMTFTTNKFVQAHYAAQVYSNYFLHWRTAHRGASMTLDIHFGAPPMVIGHIVPWTA